MDRRHFLSLASLMALPGTMLSLPNDAMAHALARLGIRAVAFDGFAIFDPRPIAALAESLFPGNGSALMMAWRTRQFDYQWLRTLSGRYVSFLQATEESLVFASRQLQLELAADKRKQLMAAWSGLQVWPDVPDVIAKLHMSGLRLAMLSNMTALMLSDGLERAGLGTMFEAVLSSDQVRAYKPDPAAYQLAIDRLRLRREQILFVAFAGWDVAGAKWFGYPTFWLNRLSAPMEQLGVTADASGQDLHSLARFAQGDSVGEIRVTRHSQGTS